jgi:hypothetical protein
MKEHYEAVLKDMESQEARLESQLAKIRAARPAILALMEDAAPKPLQAPSLFAPPKYSAMGPRGAVIDILCEADRPMDRGDIEIKLRNGGVKSNSPDFRGVVNSTLANLKKLGIVERLEEGWRLTPKTRPVDSPAPWVSNVQQRPLSQ